MIDKKTGETINTPIDMYNHGMDAGRYGMESLRPTEEDDTNVTYSGNIKSLFY